MKRKIKQVSNLPIRLNAAERPILVGIADSLGLTYKNRPSVGQILHYLAAGEAILMLHSFDTSGAMTQIAGQVRRLAESQNEDMVNLLLGLATALDRAATIRAEFEQAEADDLADDYSDRP